MIKRVAGKLPTNCSHVSNKSQTQIHLLRYKDKDCQILKEEGGKQLSGRSPSETSILCKMDSYLARCHGNTSSPRHHKVSQSGGPSWLSMDTPGCEMQRDNLEVAPVAYKCLLEKWSDTQQGA